MAERPSQNQQYDDLGAPISGAPVRSSWFGSLTAILNVIGTVLIIAMAIAVNADIIGRDAFNKPVAGVTEFIGLSIVAVVFLQMANTLRENRHVSNDIILKWVGQTHPRVSHFFYGVFHLIGASLMGLIVVFVWPMFVEMYQAGYFKGTSGVAEIPIWPFVLSVIVGGGACGVQYLLFALTEFSRAFGPPRTTPA